MRKMRQFYQTTTQLNSEPTASTVMNHSYSSLYSSYNAAPSFSLPLSSQSATKEGNTPLSLMCVSDINSMNVLLMFVLIPSFVLLLQKLTASVKLSSIKSSSSTNNKYNYNTHPPCRSALYHHRRRIQHICTGTAFYILSYAIPQSLCILLLSTFTVLLYVFIKVGCYYHQPAYQWYVRHFGSLLRKHELSNTATAIIVNHNSNSNNSTDATITSSTTSSTTTKKVRLQLPGAFWFLFGSLVTCLCFPIVIGRVGLLCLTFGDPMAAFVGLTFAKQGKNNNNNNDSSSDKKEEEEVDNERNLNKNNANTTTTTSSSNKNNNKKKKKNNKSWIGCTACFLTSFIISQVSSYSATYHQYYSPTTTSSEDIIVWDWEASLLIAVTATVMEGWLSSRLRMDDNFLIPVGTSLALWTYINYV